MSGVFKFMKGIWYGVLIGAVGALLFAPKRGEELRQDIRQQAQSLQQEAATKAQQASRELERAADKLEQRADEAQADTGSQDMAFGQ